jgi:hypothetical protein
MAPTITLQPGKIFFVLVACATFLLIAHVGCMCSTYLVGDRYLHGLVPLFDFDTERNLPTTFSAGLFLLSSALFYWVAKGAVRADERHRVWLFLSALFVFLAADEFCSIHELLGPPIRRAYNPSGLLYFAWIIPYGMAVAVLSIFVLPTIYRLAPQVRFWFGVSAVTFIAGAIGLEMAGGRRFEMLGRQKDAVFALLATLEESLEMAGLIILVYALLTLLQTEYGGFSLVVSDRSEAKATVSPQEFSKAA